MQMLPLWLWILFPGYVAVTGPRTVTGPEGGSVSVTCWYDRRYEDYGKFWCREGASSHCLNRELILETNGSEVMVRKGRVSLQDNHSLRVFTVTIEHLTKADAGTYHYGVVRTRLADLRHTVEVIVSPVSSTIETPTSTDFTTSIVNWRIATVHSVPQSSQDRHIYLLLVVGLEVPVFLCMVCAVVWVSVRYRGSSNDEMPQTSS